MFFFTYPFIEWLVEAAELLVSGAMAMAEQNDSPASLLSKYNIIICGNLYKYKGDIIL